MGIRGAKFQEITTLDQDGLEQSVISLDRYTEKDLCNRPADMNLAALAPELAAEVLRLHEALSAWIEDERAAEKALHNASGLGNTATTHTTIINRINSILNGDIQ